MKIKYVLAASVMAFAASETFAQANHNTTRSNKTTPQAASDDTPPPLDAADQQACIDGNKHEGRHLQTGRETHEPSHVVQGKRTTDIDGFDGDGDPEIAPSHTVSDNRLDSTLVVSTCHLVTDPDQPGSISENQERLTISGEGS